MLCPDCQVEMKVLSVITDPVVVDSILGHVETGGARGVLACRGAGSGGCAASTCVHEALAAAILGRSRRCAPIQSPIRQHRAWTPRTSVCRDERRLSGLNKEPVCCENHAAVSVVWPHPDDAPGMFCITRVELQ